MEYIRQSVKRIIINQYSLNIVDNVAIILGTILKVFVIITIINATLKGSVNDVLTCCKVLILFLIPWILKQKYKIEFYPIIIVLIQFFIYGSYILGELNSYYVKYPYWDDMLHTINGFLCAILGFTLMKKMSHKNSNQCTINPLCLVVFAFCFSMAIGILWEFYEFGMDSFFNRDMQKDRIIHTIRSMKLSNTGYTITTLKNIGSVSVNGQNLSLGGYLDIGLIDTMNDLFDNFIGALLFSIIGYFHFKNNKKSRFVTLLLSKERSS